MSNEESRIIRDFSSPGAVLPGCPPPATADRLGGLGERALSAARPPPELLAAVGLADAPAVLTEGRRFVCWREAARDGKPTKVPVDAHTGRDAEADNPATWATLPEALAFYDLHRDTLRGVGRMFDAEDGILGIDFDDCLDDHGNVIPGHPAAAWLPRFNSYSEVSPSGTGVKVWLRAHLEMEGKTGRKNAKLGVEVYQERRYFTLTGRRLAECSGEVEARQSEAEAFFRAIFGAKKSATVKPEAPAPRTPTTLDDAATIRRASEARNGAKFRALWAGDLNGSGSQSEADAALCSMLWFWTGDRETVRRLFGRSALGQRQKWTERPDYQESTLDLACRGDVFTNAIRPALAAAAAADWPTPEPLPEDLPTVPAFNFDCLPGSLRPWLEDIAERMQCPPDFPAVAATVALGSILGRKIGIRPKREDDWLVVPNLWGAIIGRPGLMKTPAAEQALLPLRRLVAEALKEYEGATIEHRAEALLKTQRAKIAETKIAKYLKEGDDAAARAEALAATRADDSQPTLRRFEVNDSTIAKLGELLAESPNGLLLHRDELIGFLRGLEKEGNEDARAFYLESWNGTGSFTFDRIGRGRVHVESNTLALFGGIQPDLLMAYIRSAVRGGMGADGLLQRIQLAVWPDVSKDWRNVDRWPSTKAKNEAFDVFKYLAKLEPAKVGADCASGIPFLRFDPEAQELFDQWRATLEAKLRDDSEHPAFEAHLSKYRKLVPALALLVHLADRGRRPVTLSALEKALRWATYLEAHARRIYSAVLRPDTSAARELAKHLERGELAGRFTLREVYRRGWAGLSEREDAEAATEILTDAGWIRPAADASDRKVGRPVGPAFEVNPVFRHAATPEPETPVKAGYVGFVGDPRGVPPDLHREEEVEQYPGPITDRTDRTPEQAAPPQRDYDAQPPADYLPEPPPDLVGADKHELDPAAPQPVPEGAKHDTLRL